MNTALKRLKTLHQDYNAILSPTFVIGIRHLLTCAWWSRLWVLQEATLARDAVFVCGGHTIPWKDLASLTKQVKRLDLYSILRGNDERPEFCDGFTELMNVELVRHTHSTTLAPNLLRICRQRICFDPCDRVYGVIGLMDRYVQESFTWEPGEKVEDLYPPFAAILLQLDPVAELLSLNETTHRHPKLPSWCPDLHHRSISDVLADHEGYHAGFNIQTTTRFDFDQKDPSKIRAKGIVVDTVETIDDEQWMNDRRSCVKSQLERSAIVSHNISLLQHHAGIIEQFVEKDHVWRVFVGDMVGDNDSKIHLLAGFSAIHDRLTNRRWKNEAESLQNSFHDLQIYAPGPSEPSIQIQAYLKRARRVCFGRKLFTTRSGRVGFGPQSMDVGDVVCIIKGAKVPFIFQQHPALPNTYYLRGEAYVHGIMHGEYLKVD